MSFCWNDYFSIARTITSLKGSFSLESTERCGVSRAYYAAFHHALDFAVKHAYVRKHNSADHKDVRNHLKGMSLGAVAYDLEQLHNLRKQCDYDDQVSNTNQIYSNAISLTQSVIKSL